MRYIQIVCRYADIAHISRYDAYVYSELVRVTIHILCVYLDIGQHKSIYHSYMQILCIYPDTLHVSRYHAFILLSHIFPMWWIYSEIMYIRIRFLCLDILHISLACKYCTRILCIYSKYDAYIQTNSRHSEFIHLWTIYPDIMSTVITNIEHISSYRAALILMLQFNILFCPAILQPITEIRTILYISCKDEHFF
jgi:hypothetical protein